MDNATLWIDSDVLEVRVVLSKVLEARSAFPLRPFGLVRTSKASISCTNRHFPATPPHVGTPVAV